MPNWCYNRLNIVGQKEDVKKCLDAIKEKDSVFSFEKIYPTPKELLKVPAPNRNSKLAAKLKKKYGYEDWYWWRVANWGTKWDAVESTCCMHNHDKKAVIDFLTAWGPPLQIIVRLGSMFPELKFKLYYYEPGMMFAGVFTAHGNKITDEFYEGKEHEKIISLISKKVNIS